MNKLFGGVVHAASLFYFYTIKPGLFYSGFQMLKLRQFNRTITQNMFYLVDAMNIFGTKSGDWARRVGED